MSISVFLLSQQAIVLLEIYTQVIGMTICEISLFGASQPMNCTTEKSKRHQSSFCELCEYITSHLILYDSLVQGILLAFYNWHANYKTQEPIAFWPSSRTIFETLHK